jgi:hypothetical protein
LPWSGGAGLGTAAELSELGAKVCAEAEAGAGEPDDASMVTFRALPRGT